MNDKEKASFIWIKDLRKTYLMGRQEVHALDGVDLEIEQGTFNVVMGPSGSGKSTLLYLIGGLDRPTAGRIVVEGQFIDSMDENQLARFRRRTVGFVFQSFNLVPTMTALENVAFPTQFAALPRRQQQRRAGELLERVGLGDRANHRPTELSGGQQQRVAIARALANNPQLILADEPTGNLDTTSGYSIMQLLSELHLNGCTVVVVTHDTRMSRFSTHIYYLLDGRTVDERNYQESISSQNAALGVGTG
jgi:putative ABC transport system ATP-binding protein